MRPERYSYSYNSRGGMGKSLRARALLVLMVVLAVALLIMTRNNSPRVADMRLQLGEWLAPVMETVTLPVRGFKNVMEDKTALLSVHEENKRLKDENDTLRHWQVVAESLKAENDDLRKLAGYKPVEQVEYVTAQVIAQSPSAYSGSLMINAGSDQGLHSLMPVVDAYGLVGRLVDVGETTSRVLLLTDATSRVPVVTSDTRSQAILAGTGESLLRMTFITGDAKKITLGEAVMTTAEGGLIPERVMIGTVFRRESSSGTILVKPSRPLTGAEFVRVMVAK